MRARTARRQPARPFAALVAAALLVSLTACVGMPDSGPVVEVGSDGDLDQPPIAAIDPRRPEPGALPSAVVTGFLDAMTAWPSQANVARQYLSAEAAPTWNPEQRTITYAEALPPRGNLRVSVELVEAEYLDSRGSYRGPLPARERDVAFPMVREGGEWRIAAAPDALIVPDTWFEQRFRQLSLYFFDPTAQVLVPEPVFVPRGEKQASALIEALLRGPGPALDGVSRTFLPGDLSLADLSVPVTDDGVAELSFRGFSGRLSPEASELMLAQLAWTLDQDPTIRSMRVSFGEQPVTLPGGISQVDVEEQGAGFDPAMIEASTLLYGLQQGRLVSGPPDGLVPAEGPMGTQDLGVRSIAVNLTASTVAGVSGAGDRVLLTSVRGPENRVEQVVSGARELLRPAWDFRDRLWLVDNRSDGAQVSYLGSEGPERLRVPGISGQSVTRFLVSRDGSRLVAVVRRAREDRLMVSRLVHSGDGRVLRATAAERISQGDGAGLRILDIGWNSPTSIAVLSRLASEYFQVRTVAVDGSPPGLDSLLTRPSGPVRSLAASPSADESLYAVTATSLDDLTGGEPVVQLDPGLSGLGYVG